MGAVVKGLDFVLSGRERQEVFSRRLTRSYLIYKDSVVSRGEGQD